MSLLIALGLGAALSWSIIRPVRKVDLALARIADGDFGEHVEVPNRDEFGRLDDQPEPDQRSARDAVHRSRRR